MPARPSRRRSAGGRAKAADGEIAVSKAPSPADAQQAPVGRHRHGGVLIAGAALCNLASANTLLTFTFGVFISVFHDAYGWTRADIAFAMTCFTLVVFVGSAPAGRLADKTDPALVAGLSMLLFGVGLILAPRFIHDLQSLWIAYTALAILGLGTSPVVTNRPLVAEFSKRRGLAIALAMTGSGLGGFLLPRAAAAFLERGGWPFAFTGLGWLAVLAAPIIWLALGRRVERSTGAPEQAVKDAPGASFLVIWKHRTFWILSVISLLGGLGMAGPAAHLIPLLGDHGLPVGQAAASASILGLASIAGRIVTGLALDRSSSPVMAVPLLWVGAIGIFLLGGVGLQVAFVAVFLLGFIIGAEVVILAFFVGRYFGLRSHATAFGWVYGMMALGSAIGPVAVGALRDHLGNYTLAMTLSSVALTAAGLLCLALGPYVHQPARPSAAEAGEAADATT